MIKRDTDGTVLFDETIFDFMTNNECEIFCHAVNSFFFLIPRGDKMSFKEFADTIEKVYDKSNPKTAECCRILREFDQYVQGV